MSKFISKIHFHKYKRLENLSIVFTNGINAIAGTNGTCKSSILHIISNSYQKISTRSDSSLFINDDGTPITIVEALLNSTNPKIETLNRGSKAHNDPAPGTSNYFTVEFGETKNTSFRKHNSKISNRFRVTPKYKPGKNESLDKALVAYLGIKRLVPFGEFNDDDTLKILKKNLPESYKQEICDLFKSFTSYKISGFLAQSMGLIKNRLDFTTELEGVDSNTISAGEDNLLILLTTIVCLKYFRESVKEEHADLPIILLIDEFDATLHPEFQLKLIMLLERYSLNNNIQVVFTTHSITLLEATLKKKLNVIYLINNVHNISVDTDIDIYKIQQYLKNDLPSSIYKDRKIPIFTEDNEARLFLSVLIEKLKIENTFFPSILAHLHMVNANFGCDTLKNIFSRDPIVRRTIRSICILDGDQSIGKDDRGVIAILPGKDTPENVCFEYVVSLYNDKTPEASEFWTNSDTEAGYSIRYFQSNILTNITKEAIDAKTSDDKKRREVVKDLFKMHEDFYRLVFVAWVNDPSNKADIDKFFEQFRTAFKAVAGFNNINNKLWP